MNDKSDKVCIISSVHSVFDTRIFHKEAKTLVERGYEVTLIAQHDKDETVDGVKIIALSSPKNRFWRMFSLTEKAYRIASKQKVAIYHFHDPEFLPWSVKLKKRTKAKVIYDVHEYITGQILTKGWISKPLRSSVAKCYRLIERILLPKIDWLIFAFAENSYLKPYTSYKNVSVIKNYPLVLEKFIETKPKNPSGFSKLVYVGRVSRERGVFEMIKTTKLLSEKFPNLSLNIIGQIEDRFKIEIEKTIGDLNLNRNINLLGQMSNQRALKKINEADIGLCILYPTPHYFNSLPTKILEYMTGGLPVVTSNFPLCKEVVEDNCCGLTVSPLDVKEISGAVEYLLDHPIEARKMGENGRRAVIEKYSWESEGKILIDTYRKLI